MASLLTRKSDDYFNEVVFYSTITQMDVFLLVVVAWLCVATAEFATDLAHIKALIRQEKYLLTRKYRPVYHISAPVGWISDPSSFVYFKNQYHVFYQYHPYNGAWGQMRWSHAISDNLVDWAHYPPALVPKEFYEKHGCLSGSAVVHNSCLTIFYTGHLISNNKTYQTQNIAISSDSIVFQKYLYNPVIRKGPYGASEFRNPMVWNYRNWWYMIIGTTKDRLGHLLLYSSPDLFSWTLNGTIAQSFGDMGYMWENPDLFEIEGLHVLILSVQGIQPEGYRFRNLYQTGYVVGKFNYITCQLEDLEVSTATFKELDYGHDFYAAKTMLAPDGRRLLIAWLGMWESDFQESRDGWASLLTLVREVKLTSHGRILMMPVEETKALRRDVLEDAWYSPGEAFSAGTKSFELIVNSTAVAYNAIIILEWKDQRQYTIGYMADRGHITVDRGGTDGVRRADWLPNGHIHLRIFVDYSSIEIFCGIGEIVFSSRIYLKRPVVVKIGGDTQLHITQYKLRRSVSYDNKLRKHLKHVIARNA